MAVCHVTPSQVYVDPDTFIDGHIGRGAERKHLSDEIPGGKLKTGALQAVLGKKGGRGGEVT